MPDINHGLRNLDRKEFLKKSGLDEDGFKKAREMAVAYDRVGLMVYGSLLADDALFNFQRDEIDLLWKKLEPIVMHIRESRPHYCDHFRKLATEWLERQKEKEDKGMSIQRKPF